MMERRRCAWSVGKMREVAFSLFSDLKAQGQKLGHPSSILAPLQETPSQCSRSFFFRKGWSNDTCLLLPYKQHGDGDECVEILEGKQESSWVCVIVPVNFLWSLWSALGHSEGFASANSIKTGSLLSSHEEYSVTSVLEIP